MSGGFFRGTSADQDTRFSNKQAKLLKSQKFPPELDHLVDMTKVKIDTVKPWIAKRVTELLGFEDEVLINFIYGLLDRKDVNGKEVQIHLTGFMEKNTGKFMKELWTLLLSAQKNASGIPQQILDATDEELRKKKAEADRITLEIHKRKEKEGRELQLEKLKKMDSGDDESRANKAAPDPVLKHSQARGSSEENEADERNGSRKMNRASKSPNSVDRSSFSRSPSRSVSKSFSNSRSYSDERHRSRSISRSPQTRRHSISPEKWNRSPRKRSVSPHYRHSPRKPRSPLRRRSHHSRHRSSSYSQRRSLSPVRRRLSSPSRRRSPSPVWRRSPSPVRNRSPPPLRHGLLSPVRRRSRRSPSPPRRRSPPMRRRSPFSVRRRSPAPSRRRSPPSRWSSPSPVRGRSPSPVRRSPLSRFPSHRRRSPLRSSRQRYRSRSPYKSRSPAYRSRRSLSRDRDLRANGMESRSARDDYVSQRVPGKTSPVRHTPKREVERLGQAHRGSDSESHQPRISLRSPQRDPTIRRNNQKKLALAHSPDSSQRSPESSPHMGKSSPQDDRACNPSESPVRQGKERMSHGSPSPVRQPRKHIAHHDSSETSSEEEMGHAREDGDYRTNHSERRIRHSPTFGHKNNYSVEDFQEKLYPPERVDGHQSAEDMGHPDNTELKKKDQDKKSLKASMGTDHSENPIQKDSTLVGDIEYGPGRQDGRSFVPDDSQVGPQSAKKRGRVSPSSCEKLQKSYSREGNKSEERKHSHSSNAEERDRGHMTEILRKSIKKVDRKNRPGASDSDSDSEENGKHRSDYMEKRKHKKSSRHEVASDDNAYDDSEIDERKEAKRRRKEEKRLRKEERRRRREERHRRREERRASKLKAKSVDTVAPPSDFEKIRNDVDDSELEVDARKDSNPSDTDETQSKQKKLEIELRKKALESLRAKKGTNY
ncbi:serine/arginine repetitive matrix protein 1-like [Macadamia integrifolia]|uniref:serine/arginine repetitive matrix protein 1-like n=1 Tax=Macadamia integrifolia TaxID=60698 RepID=UPI001C4F78DF|nr:serine/arginine repetitive matrix protein 1-like [Macadamia integrifolia]